MLIADSIHLMREALTEWRRAGDKIAFVPTMGNLHLGHLKLVQEAKLWSNRVIVSSFVNPSQFCPGEDYDAYPRTPLEDEAKLRALGCDLLFMPMRAEMYPEGCSTEVRVDGLSDLLCGQFRPGHFKGVTTIVCKLFNMVQPDAAFFGEKDYQQLMLIRKMVLDLNLPIDIYGVPTVREPCGLALSSRNAYLTEAERLVAPELYRSLQTAGALLAGGDKNYTRIEAEQFQALIRLGFDPDYFSIRRAIDLSLPNQDERDFVILLAAKLGKSRLIDNLKLSMVQKTPG